jgi:predicted ArsR family transcriptional regulator
MLTERHAQAEDLDRLADALAEPTRRAIFLLVSESADALTAGTVAERVGLHRTVARSHLERLVEAGLLKSAHLHRGEGGRPPKVYERSDRRLDLQLPARQYELLAELLLETLDRFGDAAECMAREVGHSFGERLALSAGAVGLEDRLALLRRGGAVIDATRDEEAVNLCMKDCLFREVSGKNPRLVCALDRALMQGLLSAGRQPYELSDVSRRCEQDDVCRLTYTVQKDEWRDVGTAGYANLPAATEYDETT